MNAFYKQFIFISVALAILMIGGIVIHSATPSGKIAIKLLATAKIKMVKQENATSSANNPVVWWKMDEGSGLTLSDSSGNGNTGIASSTMSASTMWVNGKLGKALQFDGVDDYVSFASMPITGAEFTISVWAKELGSGGGLIGVNLIFEQENTVLLRPSVKLWASDSSSKVVFEVRGSNTTSKFLIASHPNQGVWHHYVGVVDATKASLYIDGVLIVGPEAHNQTGGYTSGVDIYNIGRERYSGLNMGFFNGQIDDARIYNRALSDREIVQIYNSTKDGYLGSIKVSTGLAGYWKLDDNNALTSVIDYSGKRNTGTAYSNIATSTSALSTSTAMVGRAMSFDGVDDYMYISSGDFATTTVSTISAWVRPSSVPLSGNENYFIFDDTTGSPSLYDKGGPSIVMYNGKISISGGYSGTSYNEVESSITLTANNWYYVVGIFNSSTKLVQLYVNGVYQDDNNNVYCDSTTIGNSTIGDRPTSSSAYPWKGVIDEVRIWNYARSAEQILQDYQRGLNGLP